MNFSAKAIYLLLTLWVFATTIQGVVAKPTPPQKVLLIAYKKERVLEVWTATNSQTYTLYASYPFCSASGWLGPKRHTGDQQVPEGLYHIQHFNPQSAFHLSLGINYPNKADKLRHPSPWGGDIYIHGGCASIGCIAITNPVIDIVYPMAEKAAKATHAPVPVFIFPAKLTNARLDSLCALPDLDSDCVPLWRQLAPIYQAFAQTHTIPVYSIDEKGRYVMAVKKGK